MVVMNCLSQNISDTILPKQRSLASEKKVPWQWIAPATLTGLGIWGSIDKNLRKRKPEWKEPSYLVSVFNKPLDDYLYYLPSASVYLMHLAGNKPRHDVVNYSVILLKSELIMLAVVTPLKKFTHVLRPDSADYKSFPSGHTTQAFLAANFLRHEFGHKSTWYSIAGYTVATGVGLLRLKNNKHWVSDVLAGAGIGILCSEIAYATHQYKWNKKNKLSFFPTFSHSGPGFYLAWKL